MKHLIFVLLFFQSLAGYSQFNNFFDLQQAELKLWDNYEKELNDSIKIFININKLSFSNDSAKINTEYRHLRGRRLAVAINKKKQLLPKLIYIDLPDIIFTDEKDKAYSLSDFSDQKIILNFNYSFCQECINQLDSIIESKPKKSKLIVLLSDSKDGASHVLDKYRNEILIGFINKENEKIYTLNCGTPFTYLLDESRKITYSNSWFYTDNKLELIAKIKLF